MLYGYAYRGRWMWVNNYRDDRFFAIWKDYNCEEPYANEWGMTTEDFAIKGIGENLSQLYWWAPTTNSSPLYVGDPWALTYNLIRAVQPIIGNTVSGVLSYGQFSEVGVQVCLKADGDLMFETSDAPGTGMAQWVAFETREGFV